MNGSSSSYYDILLSKISSKKFNLCIVGLGYVGLPLSFHFARAGVHVIGIDISEKRINELKNYTIPFSHLNTPDNIKLLSSGLINFSLTYDACSEADVIIVCVPTPLTKYLEPDLSFVTDAFTSLSQYLVPGQLVILESTTYPGTTAEVVMPLLTSTNLKIGSDLFLGYSPEREDPGNKDFDASSIPKIVSGISPDCLECTSKFYQTIVPRVVKVSSTQVAELTKILENVHRSVNIGLMNEIKPLCNEMGIDIFEVIEAASTKPFGFTPYYPGPGLGGHCIPIDPFYLAWKAREYGIRTKFIELAGEINANMPNYVLDLVVQVLNDSKKSLRGAFIHLIGVAYKRNIEDLRCSPAITLFNLLLERGSVVNYSDPYIPTLFCMGHEYRSQEISQNTLANSDLVIILTDHDVFDYGFIQMNSSKILDARGRLPVGPNVWRA
jgi:UDP-N-acetyl-D-glucosamine dehydrogenase